MGAAVCPSVGVGPAVVKSDPLGPSGNQPTSPGLAGAWSARGLVGCVTATLGAAAGVCEEQRERPVAIGVAFHR